MANVIKLHKGLDIHLQGKAEVTLIPLKSNGQYALVPDDFEGVTPKVVVREGDTVKAGDALFVANTYFVECQVAQHAVFDTSNGDTCTQFLSQNACRTLSHVLLNGRNTEGEYDE